MMGNVRENSKSLGLRRADSFTQEGRLFDALVMRLEHFYGSGLGKHCKQNQKLSVLTRVTHQMEFQSFCIFLWFLKIIYLILCNFL